MTKIYVVTEGEYSDYGIEAVYSSKKLAERYVELWGGEIEEYELNPAQKELKAGLSLYQVCIRRDGNIDHVNRSIPTEDNLGVWYFSHNNEYMVYRIIADSEERAIKVANEKRTMILAEKLWGKQYLKEIKERLDQK